MRSIIILLAALSFTAAFDLDCKFMMNKFSWLTEDYYSCRRDNMTAATSRDDRYVDFIKGTHMDGKTHDDVRGIHLRGDRMYFFPLRFDRFFKHLRVIAVEYMQILEIRSTDLMPYGELEYLYLSYNMLEVLEMDLFKYNKNLKGVSIEHNRLRFIHSKVFDEIMPNLTFMHMEKAGCVDLHATGDMHTAIETMKDKCSEYDNFSRLLTDLYFAQRYRQMV